jgi:cytidylate kinase
MLDDVSSPDRHPGLVVALDGPSSSGKSSVGSAAALRLGYRFCDTGLLYRAATWIALKRGLTTGPDGGEPEAQALVALVPEIELIPDENGRLAHVSVDGEDVTDDVHTPRVDEAVSAVSRVPELRTALLERQRSLAAESVGIIMAGRDIGTVVLPDADLKIFLDASAEERARRRAEERGLDPAGPEAQAILDQLRRRDALDTTRTTAPLRPADDAVHIVTDGNEFDQTVDAVVDQIRAGERSAAESLAARAPR